MVVVRIFYTFKFDGYNYLNVKNSTYEFSYETTA
jgi:hypothetical protein